MSKLVSTLCVLAAVFATAVVHPSANGMMTSEHFNNQGEFAHYPFNNGVGWIGGWDGFTNGMTYEPGHQLNYSGGGYSNFGNESGPEDGRLAWLSFLGPSGRRFIATGQTAWMSVLVDLGENYTYSGMYIGRDHILSGHTLFGIDNSGRAYLGSTSNVSASPFVHNVTHVMLMKYDPRGAGSASLWVDPADMLNGEAGLGTPTLQVSSFSYALPGSWENIVVDLGGTSSRLDSIRISTGHISSTARLQEVVTGQSFGERVIVPSGSSVSATALGGLTQAGGLSVHFTESTSGGELAVDYESLSQAEFFQRLSQGEFVFNDFNYTLPGNRLMLWDISYWGSFTGVVNLTLRYDETAVTNPSTLVLLHRVNGVWETLFPLSVDPFNFTATFATPSFSPFVLATIPEPSSFSALVFAMILSARRRR